MSHQQSAKSNWWRAVLVFAGVVSFPQSFAESLHSFSGKAVDGKVIEESTGKPLAGAIVIVTWSGDAIPTGFTAHNPPTVCYHAETATTDEEGRYHISAWKSRRPFRVRNQNFSAMAYKAGYLWRPYIGTTITLAPADGNRKGLFYRNIPDCYLGGESRRNLFPMLKAMYDELKPLAETDDEKLRITDIRRSAAEAAIAGEAIEESKISNKKVEAFMKDNLP